jgi:hypothetical protein
MLTTKYDAAVLQCDQVTGTIVTRSSGNVADNVGRQAEAGAIVVIDPVTNVCYICLFLTLKLYFS